MNDPIKTIGQILTGREERDCIHVAIMPAIAAEKLHRGQEVALVYGTTNQVKGKRSVYGLATIGIVDPFLGLPEKPDEDSRSWKHRIEKGQHCWVFLFPGTTTGMRHHWTLPAIDNPKAPASESEKWLRQFADKWHFIYDEMIQTAMEDEGYAVALGRDLHDAADLAPGEEDLFWQHIENLTGQKFSEAHRHNFTWSCSC